MIVFSRVNATLHHIVPVRWTDGRLVGLSMTHLLFRHLPSGFRITASLPLPRPTRLILLCTLPCSSIADSDGIAWDSNFTDHLLNKMEVVRKTIEFKNQNELTVKQIH